MCWQTEIQVVVRAGKLRYKLFYMLANGDTSCCTYCQTEIQVVVRAAKLRYKLYMLAN